MLDMQVKDRDWHLNDIADELKELDEATGFIDRWSEYSDVVYTVTRGRWTGHHIPSPLHKKHFIYGSLYMFPKYSLRWAFYSRAGKKAGANRKVTEVRNPKKIHKLHHIANKYDLDEDIFVQACKKQLKYWPLLK